jgi:hypothetical protein
MLLHVVRVVGILALLRALPTLGQSPPATACG